jgi:hypothetical protein
MGAGRPKAVTEAVLHKLEEAFAMGCTDAEACLFADICQATLYNYQNENPEFIDRKARLKTNPVLKARKVLLDAIDDQKDAKVAQWMVEKLDGKAKQAVTVEGGEKPVEMVFKWKG